MEGFILFRKNFEHFKMMHKVGQTEMEGAMGDNFMLDIDRCIPDAKIFEMNENIKRLLVLTNPPTDKDLFKLPFENVFIDASFTKEELAKLGVDIEYDEINGFLIREGALVRMDDKTGNIIDANYGKTIRVSICATDHKAGLLKFDTFTGYFDPDSVAEEEVKNVKKQVLNNKGMEPSPKGVKAFSQTFVLNFLYLLNDPMTEVVVIEKSLEANQKRMKRGKVPLPTRSIIQVTGTIKRYIDSISKNDWECPYAYWVRGFYRVLRSPRYGKNQGKKLWVVPHIRNKGKPLIDKTFVLKGLEEVNPHG